MHLLMTVTMLAVPAYADENEAEKLFPPRFFGYTFLGDAKKVFVASS